MKYIYIYMKYIYKYIFVCFNKQSMFLPPMHYTHIPATEYCSVKNRMFAVLVPFRWLILMCLYPNV